VARATPHLRSRTFWPWALAGAALGLLLALLLFAPARWLATTVTQGTDGRVLLADVRGTVWNGSAELVLTGGAGSVDAAALPTRVEWRLHPRWNGVAADVSSACCTTRPVRVRAGWRWGGAHVDIAESQSRWPASLLVGMGTPWNTLQLAGDLRLQTKGLSVEWVAGRLAIAGQAELTAQRLSSRLSTLRPMGSYRMTVQGGQTPTLQLDTLEGSLNLSGSGTWVGSRLRFSGVATAAPDRESALSNLLNIIGRRSGARSIITIG
jgi:general secretion pathway protein N